MPLPVPPRMPHRLDPVHLDDAGFPGFIFLAWTSAPLSLTDSLRTIQNENEGRELLLRLIPEWNFVDEDGEPIEHTVEGFNKMPQLLVSQMMARYKLVTMGLTSTGEVEKKLDDPFEKLSIIGSSTDKPTTPDQSQTST